MPIDVQCSARMEVLDGVQFMLSLGYAYQNKVDFTKVVHPPQLIPLTPLQMDYKVNLYEITTAKAVLITSDRDVDVKVGSSTNTPVRLRADVPSPADSTPNQHGVLLLTADFVNDPNPVATTGLFISNPSGLYAANITVAAIGI